MIKSKYKLFCCEPNCDKEAVFNITGRDVGCTPESESQSCTEHFNYINTWYRSEVQRLTKEELEIGDIDRG